MDIVNLTADWELASALRLPHRLPISPVWERDATVLDKALLDGRAAVIQAALDRGYRQFTQWSARCIVRFANLDALELLLRTLPQQLHDICDDLLPNIASAWGRVEVLRWAVASGFGIAGATEVAMDDASRHGHVDILNFWRNAGQPLLYSESALASATFNRQIEVLDWWRRSGLDLKIGKVYDFASMSNCTATLQWWFDSGLQVRYPHKWYSRIALYEPSLRGYTSILDWWLASGLTLDFGPDVLVGATKHGRRSSLDWWAGSGLDLTFSWLDVEEAVVDCIGDQVAVEAFWKERGLGAVPVELWTKPQSFRSGSAIRSLVL